MMTFRHFISTILFAKLCLVLILFACSEGAFSQRTVKVVEWNVENLFDLRHDSLKNDYDFLPEGDYHWTPSRYWRKLNEIGKTLAAIGAEDGMPALVGLCEVENDSVLFDLTRRSLLRTANYEYVVTQSADHRGVDVALLYQPFLFRVLTWHSIRIPSVEQGFNPTRDLLYAKGVFLSGDTLHLMVCHFPSKAGGGNLAARHRSLAASTMRMVVDSVLSENPDAKLLVMGDFNASYGESIFTKLLPPLCETLPVSRKELSKAVGTYYFQKRWSYLDHILVSESLYKWQNEPHAYEVRLPFLLDKKGVPRRTFKGTGYNGGLSDHLPLCLEICLPK